MSLGRRRINEHEVCREEVDLFVYRFPRGAITADHMDELTLLERDAWREGVAQVHLLVVLGKDISIEPGALTRTAQIVRPSPPRVTAYVVSRFLHRVAMEFLGRASRGVGVKSDARIFDDEAKARAWITRRREGRVSLPSAEVQKA